MDLKKVNRIFVFCFVFLSFIACDTDKVYDEYHSLNDEFWKADHQILFDVEIQDTLQKNNLFLNLRTDNDFPYRNLFVISKITNPEGYVVKDTLEYLMADPYGNWLGEGFTEVRNNKLVFLENYQFQKTGNYTFEFVQAVRKRGELKGDSVLTGVLDVGLRIEKSLN